MIDFDDGLNFLDEAVNKKPKPSITVTINRPGINVNEYSVLSLKGNDVDSLYDVLDFFSRVLNAAGFTYVDSLHINDPF
jgi:hypothetical protein